MEQPDIQKQNLPAKHNQHWVWLSMVVIALLAITASAFFVYKQLEKTKQQLHDQEAVKKDQANATDEIANWKTYRNEEYGFEIKIPNFWELVQEDSNRDGTYQGNPIYFPISCAPMALGVFDFVQHYVDTKYIGTGYGEGQSVKIGFADLTNSPVIYLGSYMGDNPSSNIDVNVQELESILQNTGSVKAKVSSRFPDFFFDLASSRKQIGNHWVFSFDHLSSGGPCDSGPEGYVESYISFESLKSQKYFFISISVSKTESALFQKIIQSFKFIEPSANTGNSEVCAQVITRAFDPATGQEGEFPTPCDVPPGWQVLGTMTQQRQNY